MKKSFLKAVCAVFAGMLAFAQLCPSAAAMNVSYIYTNVKVAFFEQNGFYEYSPNFEPTGYGVDYLERIAAETGWRYSYVPADDWADAKAMLDDGKVDLIAPSHKTDGNDRSYLFSKSPIGTDYGAIIADAAIPVVYEDFTSFSNIRFGCAEDSPFIDGFFQYADVNGFTPNITYYKNDFDLFLALGSEVDAAVSSMMYLDGGNRLLGKFAPTYYYYMGRRDERLMFSELDNAISKIKLDSPGFEMKLIEKYYPEYLQTPMTHEELTYIKSAPAFVIGCASDHYPISYVDEKTGSLTGITHDLLEKISRTSGLRFEYVPIESTSISYDTAKSLRLDMIAGLPLERKSAGDIMTEPYFSSQKVLVGRREDGFSKEAHLTAAVSKQSGIREAEIKKHYPNFTVLQHDSLRDCFDAVNSGHADVLIDNQYAVAAYISGVRYDDMYIFPSESIDDSQCLSTVLYTNDSKDTYRKFAGGLPITVINKSIDMLSDDEVSSILIDYTANRPYRFTLSDLLYRYRMVLTILVEIFMMLIIAILFMLLMRRRSVELMKKSEGILRDITNNIQGGMVRLVYDGALKIAYANEGFWEMTALSPKQYQSLGRCDFERFISEGDRAKLSAMTELFTGEKRRASLKLELLQSGGQIVPVQITASKANDIYGERSLYCVIMDCSEQEMMMNAILLEQTRYRFMMERSEEMIFDADPATFNIAISDVFRKKFGWAPKTNFNWLDPDALWWIGPSDKELFLNMVRDVRSGAPNGECVCRIVRADGEYIWCRIVLHEMLNKGIRRIIGKVTDIDEETRERRMLLHQSRHDPLTNLYNKNTFIETAGLYLREHEKEHCAVLFLDLDDFKLVNDFFGHLQGDKAIIEASEKLRPTFSSIDIVSRFGGDEFCVLLKNIPRAALIKRLYATLSTMHATYFDENHTVDITASIGVACSPENGNDISQLLENADKALYYAKEHGKNSFVFYNDDLKISGYIGRS